MSSNNSVLSRSSMESIHQSSWNLRFLVCPIPSTYVGMPSPALGPAVLCWGDDDNVASLPPHNTLRPDSAVWPWHISSIWLLLGAPKVLLYSTVVSGLCHLPPQMKNQHGLNEKKNLYRGKIVSQLSASEVTCVISLDTNNQAKLFEESRGLVSDDFCLRCLLAI